MRLAVVEDDDGVGEALVEAFTVRGHQAVRMRRGADVLTAHRGFDAVVLDLGLPDADGLTVLRQLREVTTVPVVILTARSDERSIVRGLRGGADDYVIKPPRIAELLARLENATRRSQPATAAPDEARVVEYADVRVDLTARRVQVGGVEIALTAKEFALVEVLTARPGTAVSRQQLMDRIWGDAFVAVSRSLDVHMTGLRAKLDRPGLITTIRGYGYRWGA
ncbi:response regulator transcription factor [Nocardia sp. NPDC059240]|uniref:response regulator transcription factor n=1 Tax=Nocardia sp. NPDC059240 TaxID=3346786 RepID=UPI0036A99DD1